MASDASESYLTFILTSMSASPVKPTPIRPTRDGRQCLRYQRISPVIVAEDDHRPESAPHILTPFRFCQSGCASGANSWSTKSRKVDVAETTAPIVLQALLGARVEPADLHAMVLGGRLLLHFVPEYQSRLGGSGPT